MKSKSLILPLLFSLFLSCTGACLSACNTVKGVGQDIKSAGQTIEKTAQHAKPY